jgi:hypothetical protein
MHTAGTPRRLAEGKTPPLQTQSPLQVSALTAAPAVAARSAWPALTNAIDSQRAAVAAVQERAQHPLHARRVLRQQAARQVGEALVDDGVLGVELQAEALQRREGAQDQAKVGWDWRRSARALCAGVVQARWR